MDFIVRVVSEEDKKKPTFKVEIRNKKTGKVAKCTLNPMLGGYHLGMPIGKGCMFISDSFAKKTHKTVEDFVDAALDSEKYELISII